MKHGHRFFILTMLSLATAPFALGQPPATNDEPPVPLSELKAKTAAMTPQASALVSSAVPNRSLEGGSIKSEADLSAATVTQHLEKIQRQYNKRREHDEVSSVVAKTTFTAIYGVAGALNTINPEPVSKIGATLTLKGLKMVTDRAIDGMNQKALQQAQNVVQHHLNNMDEAVAQNLRELSKESPERAREEMSRNVNEWTQAMTVDIKDDNERTAVRSRLNIMMTKVALSEIAGESSRSQKADQQHDENIEAQGQQMVKIERSLHQYYRNTNRALQTIAVTQGEIFDGVKEIYNQGVQTQKSLNNIQSDVGFTNEILFGKLSTDEKIKALNHGMFSEMDPAERQKTLTKLEIVKKQETVINTADSLINGAQDLANIAGTLGVDPKVVSTLSNAARTGQGLMNGIKQAMSGNMLGAVSSVVSAFLGGGPSIEEQRHEEIIGKLDSLLDGQRDMLANQEKMLENQKKILAGLRDLSLQMAEFAQEVRNNQAQTMGKLESIHRDIYGNRVLLNRLLNPQLEACHVFFSDKHREEYGYRGGVFASYEDLSHFFHDYSREWSNCLNGLNDLMALTNVESRLSYEFWLDPDSPDAAKIFYTNVYRPTWTYYQIKTGLQNFEKPYASSALIQEADNALAIAPWMEIVEGDSGKYSVIEYKDLDKQRFRSKRGIQLVQEVLERTQEALAQEQILAGTEKIFSALLVDLMGKDDAARQIAIQVINANQLLGQNFVNWYVLKKLRDLNTSVSSYSWLTKIDASSNLVSKLMSDSIWGLHFQDTDAPGAPPRGWSVKIGEVSFALPDGSELLPLNINQRSIQSDLLALQDRLQGWLAEVAVSRNTDKALSPEQMNTLHEVYLYRR